MLDRLDPPSQPSLEQAVTQAIEKVLRREATAEGRIETLRTVRRQLEKVFAEAPVSGDSLSALAIRARLAALCDAAIAHHEAQVS